MQIRKFETGEKYELRFIGDSTIRVPVLITKRTAKYIFVDYEGGKRIGVKIHNGVEHAQPAGQYSMAPSIRADKKYNK